MNGLEHLFSYPEESTFITSNRTANADNFLIYLQSAILSLEDSEISHLIFNLERAKQQLKYLLPSTSPEDETFLARFKTECSKLSAKMAELNIESYLAEHPLAEDCKNFFDPYIENWISLRENLSLFLSVPKRLICRIQGWKQLLEDFELELKNSSITYQMNALDVRMSAASLSDAVWNLKLAMPAPESLEYVENTASQEGERALDDFIRIGQRIRTAQVEYDESFSSKLENALENPTEIIVNQFRKVFHPENINALTCFTALAAPSMEGKTQFAFSLRVVKPLYFPMSEARRAGRQESQPIYTNFTNLARALFNCAHRDLESLDNNWTKNILSSGSAFWTVGFLLKLIEESKDFPSGEDWMRCHSQRPGFTFRPLTIEKATGKFSGYVLVLDEFSAEPENALVRNIARALGLHCMVINTNTNVTTIVGKDTASAGASESIWSLVVPKLGHAFIKVLDAEHGLLDSIHNLVSDLPLDHPIRKLLARLLDSDLQHLRPGVAEFLSKILRRYVGPSGPNAKLGPFLDKIINELAVALIGRKKYLGKKQGMLGHIALLLPESYGETLSNAQEVAIEDFDDNDVLNAEDDVILQTSEVVITTFNVSQNSTPVNRSEAWNQARFIEHHLFYLRNPVDPESNAFLTFPPDEEEGNLMLYSSSAPEWSLAQSEFDPQEFFTIAACLFIPFTASVARILLHANLLIANSTASVATSQNLRARALDGNTFEVTSAVCVIRSSHYSINLDQKPVFTFKGQSGREFISNLVHEMSYSSGESRLPPIFPAELNRFLGRIRIPFLYSMSYDNPSFQLLTEAGFDQEVFVSSYERTSNEAQIDGKFRARDGRNLITICAECKNRANEIGSPELLKILLKCALHKAKLSLVFCTQFSATAKPNAKFRVYCAKYRINVYRVATKRVEGRPVFVPFTDDFLIHKNPSSTCLVLETCRIL